MSQVSVVRRCLDAIERGDPETIEGLRDLIRPVHLDGLMLQWRPDLPWAQKDGWIHLLMDQPDKRLRRVWEDGLDSPTLENRAVCISWLGGVRFEELMRDGGVDPARVEAAIARHRGQAAQGGQWSSAVRFDLQVGPGQGADSARPTHLAASVPAGVVAMRLHRPGAPLGVPQVGVRLRGHGRVQTESLAEVPAGHDTLYKSWRIEEPGTYTIEVWDPRSGRELAQVGFELTWRPAG